MDNHSSNMSGKDTWQRRQRPPMRGRNRHDNRRTRDSGQDRQEAPSRGHRSAASADPSSVALDFGHVSTDTKAYFKSVEARMDEQHWESDDELHSFLSNVYGEVVGNELSLATDPDCSIVLQKLLHVSTDTHLRIFLDKLSGNYVHLSKHFCASHVIQSLLTLSAATLERECVQAQRGSSADGPEELPSMSQLFKRLCEQLQSFWGEIISDSHASFVARTLLSVLAGVPIDATGARSKNGRQWAEKRNIPAQARLADCRSLDHSRSDRILVPEMCRLCLESVLDELDQVLGSRIRTYAFDPIVSPVAQQYLEILPDKSDVLATLLMKDDGSLDIDTEQRDTYIRSLMTHPVASRLLELALRYCPDSLFLDFFDHHGRGSLGELCRHPVANFAVQALVGNAKNTTQLEIMVKELAPAFGDLLFGGRPLVVLKCIEAGSSLGISRTVLNHVYQAVAPSHPRDLFPMLLFLQRQYPDPATLVGSADSNPPRHSNARRDSGKHPDVNRAGNQIVSCISALPAVDHRELVDSFLARDMAWYHPLLLHPIASYTMQAFLNAPTVNARPKRKLLFSLLNAGSSLRFVDLAVNKFGSHIADTLWSIADLDAKTRIASHLLEHEKKMTESQYGRFVWRNFNLVSFKSKRQDWIARQKGLDKKRDLFRELLPEADASRTLALAGPSALPPQPRQVATAGRQGSDALATSSQRPFDEIDVLFQNNVGQGRKLHEVEYVSSHESMVTTTKDKSLELVLGAIEATRKRKKRSQADVVEAGSEEGSKRKRQKRQFK